MKKTLFACLATASLLLIGCAENKDFDIPQTQGETTLKQMVGHMKVNVPNGKIVIAMNGQDTVAVCRSSQDIITPYESEITLVEIDANEGNNKLQEQNQIYEVVAFEDSKAGDYDYNDLVIHAQIRYFASTGDLEVIVQPVALGALKNFGLGASVAYRDTNGNKTNVNTDWTLANDCRTEYFEGQPGFVNTVKDGFFKKYETLYRYTINVNKPNNATLLLDWYLNVGGERLYAVSENYPCAQESNLRPYGLIFTNIHKTPFIFNGSNCGYDWWNYPIEKTSVDKIYPFSARFFAGTSTDFMEFGLPTGDEYYNAIGEGVLPQTEIKGTSVEPTAIYAINYKNNIVNK